MIDDLHTQQQQQHLLPTIKTSMSKPEIITVSYEDLIEFDTHYTTTTQLQQSLPNATNRHHNDDGDNQQRNQQPASTSQSKSLRLLERIGYHAFGPGGLGIVIVQNVPNFVQYRQQLLPLAAQLPKIPNIETSTCVNAESYYSVGWSHGKEILSQTGEPDLFKGSYYANPFTDDLLSTLHDRDGYCAQRERTAQLHPEFYANNIWPPPQHSQIVPHFKVAFCNMGKLLHAVGCMIAKVCDTYCYQYHPQQIETNIASTIIKSKNSNGRLLHYFPMSSKSTTTTDADADNDDTNETNAAKTNMSSTSSDNDRNNTNNDAPTRTETQPQQPWCTWHNDHGCITGLVPGMYIDTRTGMEIDTTNKSNNSSCNMMSNDGGLYIQARNGQCVHVPIPPDCCAFQIGETSQIMSGGLLQATPHAVYAPSSFTTTGATTAPTASSPFTSRESFALFLEPEFDDPLVLPPTVQNIDDCGGSDATNTTTTNQQRFGLRPLSERYKPGQTFGDFHLATMLAFTAAS